MNFLIDADPNCHFGLPLLPGFRLVVSWPWCPGPKEAETPTTPALGGHNTTFCARNHPTTNAFIRKFSLESRQKSQMPLEFGLLGPISELPDLEMPLGPTLANS